VGQNDKKKFGETKGASMVEFALVLPFLILILFGVIEFGILIYNQQVITNASREGARYGIVLERKTQNQIASVVEEYTTDRLVSFGTNKNINIEFPNWISDSPNTGDDLRVRVEYEFVFLVLPNYVFSLSGPINLTAETVMKYE
jgi:Flp pilus assembly protein TadG